MRFGARSEGISPSFLNMSRTDWAGIAIFVCVAIFIAVLIKVMSE